jgi:hypothetical protein
MKDERWKTKRMKKKSDFSSRTTAQTHYNASPMSNDFFLPDSMTSSMTNDFFLNDFYYFCTKYDSLSKQL